MPKSYRRLSAWFTTIAIGIASVMGIGCAAHTNIQPVGKGELRLNGGFGGPIVAAFGTHVPIPYFSAGANYGLSDAIDFNGNLHLLSLAYSLAGADAGVTWYPLVSEDKGVTLGLGGRLSAFASLKSDLSERFRLYPSLTSSAAWHLGSGMIFGGLDLTIPFSKPAYDTAAASFLLSPLVGYRWKLGEETNLFTEIRWQGANVRADQLPAEYVSPGGYGAITPFISFEWRLR